MKNILYVTFVASLVLGSMAFDWPWARVRDDLPVVDHIDLDQFVGHWYEMARLPHKKEMNCICSQQDIEVIDNEIIANSTCHPDSLLNPMKVVELHYIPLDQSYAKWHIEGAKPDFWIIDIADDYSWMMGGDPDREYLWISSRDELLDFSILKLLIEKAKDLGFPVEDLVFQGQICGDNFKMTKKKDLPSVDSIDVAKLVGQWYEIARLRHKEEKNCVCNQQDIEIINNEIIANNTCYRDSILNPLTVIQFEMDPIDETNARFHIPDMDFDIYIIDIADDYSWKMAGDPDRTHLWIGAREPILDAKIVRDLVKRAKKLGFDVDDLVYPGQLCGNNFD